MQKKSLTLVSQSAVALLAHASSCITSRSHTAETTPFKATACQVFMEHDKSKLYGTDRNAKEPTWPSYNVADPYDIKVEARIVAGRMCPGSGPRHSSSTGTEITHMWSSRSLARLRRTPSTRTGLCISSAKFTRSPRETGPRRLLVDKVSLSRENRYL
ncbi:hypothetical protein F4824DRAFT_61676 [Ustulina deusta]|nr:hypothetical protein F4824DRAFT_61676 [Ustulina deusta]